MRSRILLSLLLLTVLTPLTLLGGDRSPPTATALGAPFAMQHSPAAGSQATITQAAGGAGVRNIVEAVSFSYSATTALAGITTVTINLRDGATGAGTVLQSWNYTLPAAVIPAVTVSLASLHIQGSANTATTLEFSAAVGNLVENVNLVGYTSP